MSWIGALIFAFADWLKTTQLAELSVWIAQTRVGVAINQNNWITPTVQSIHILAIAATFTAALMINLRIMRLSGQGHSMAEVEHRYAPWVWWGLLVLTVTGVLLVVAEPARELLDPLFWTKLALIAAIAVGTLWFQKSVRQNSPIWDPASHGYVAFRVAAAVIIGVWCVIMVLGRWIAYLGI